MAFGLQEILIGLLGLTIVVSIHEFGHLLAAKLFGITVQVFSIGWGPKLWGFMVKGTEYRVSLIPLGGYCRMKGEEDMQSALANKKEYVDQSPGSFYSAKPYQRIIVSFAGPFFNVVSAIVFLGLLAMPSSTVVLGEPRIALSKDYGELVKTFAHVNENLLGDASPAYRGGLKTGDLVLQVDGKPIKTFSDLAQGISSKAGGKLELLVWRNEEKIVLSVEPELDQAQGTVNIGILNLQRPIVRLAKGNAAQAGIIPGDIIRAIDGKEVAWNLDVEYAVLAAKGPVDITVQRNGERLTIKAFPELIQDVPRLSLSWEGIHVYYPGKNIFEAIPAGAEQTLGILGSIIDSFKFFSMGLDPSLAVSGPLRSIGMIGNPVSKALDTSIEVAIAMFARILGIFSIALFFGNLLPIPVLDGGQIVLSTVELLRKKPLKIKTIQIYNTIGMLLILPILALAVFGDFRLFF